MGKFFSRLSRSADAAVVNLDTVLRSNHATVFNEVHETKDIVTYYRIACGAARRAGIKDIMFEIPPEKQKELDRKYKVFRKELAQYAVRNDGKEEILGRIQTGLVSSVDFLAAIAAVFDLTPHAVDVADRSFVKMFEAVNKMIAEAMPKSINTREERIAYIRTYINSIDLETMRTLSEKTGMTVTREELNDLYFGTYGRDLWYARVVDGDKEIAALMHERSEGRPFIAIMGQYHGGVIDEVKEGYLHNVDIDGALRLLYGASKVCRIEFDQKERAPVRHQPNYRLKHTGKLEPIELVVPEIDEDIRERALRNHGLRR